MESLLHALIIKRFRSIPAQTIHFDNPTFLIGRNGAGKSNIKDAIDFLAEITSSPLQAVFDRRGGISTVRNRASGHGYPPNLGLGVLLETIDGSERSVHYAFEIKATRNHGFEVVRERCTVVDSRSKPDLDANFFIFDRRRDLFESNVPGLKPLMEPGALALPLVGGDSHFAPVVRALGSMRSYAIEPARLREMQDPDSGLVLKPDGSNAASVLQEILRQSPEDADRINQLLATIVPNTTQVRPIKHGNKMALEFTQEWAPGKRLKFESFNMSDGTLRAFGMLMAVYQKPTPGLIILEEPGSGPIGGMAKILSRSIVMTWKPSLCQTSRR